MRFSEGQLATIRRVPCQCSHCKRDRRRALDELVHISAAAGMYERAATPVARGDRP
jgi:hypothetical protein